jgi:hypothetical protein
LIHDQVEPTIRLWEFAVEYEFEALKQYVEEQQPAVIFEALAEEEGLERLLEAGVPAKILSPFVKQSAETHIEALYTRGKDRR